MKLSFSRLEKAEISLVPCVSRFPSEDERTLTKQLHAVRANQVASEEDRLPESELLGQMAYVDMDVSVMRHDTNETM